MVQAPTPGVSAALTGWASSTETVCDIQLESHLFPETSIKTRSDLVASENLCGLCKHYNHFAQLTTTACRRKVAVIWHCTARKQESRAGGKVTARGAKRSLGRKNVIIPTKMGAERSFLERVFNFCTQRQRYFHAVTHIPPSQPLLILCCSSLGLKRTLSFSPGLALLSFFRAQLHQEAFENNPCFLFYRWLSTSAHRTGHNQPPGPSLTQKKP